MGSVAKRIALYAMFVALIIVGAFIKIPIPPVPFTLQTLFVLLAATLLGSYNGLVCVAIYIFMGLIGIPVFTAGGGFGYVLTPTFGFLIGFAVGSLVTGLIVGKRPQLSWVRIIVAVAVGTVLVYVVGLSYYFILKAVYLGGEVDVWKVFVSFWFLFIPTDLVKGAIVVFATKRVRPYMVGHNLTF